MSFSASDAAFEGFRIARRHPVAIAVWAGVALITNLITVASLITIAGPQMASFFLNLTPLFAALLSAAFLREVPHWYHAAAFALIVGGIVVSARR